MAKETYLDTMMRFRDMNRLHYSAITLAVKFGRSFAQQPYKWRWTINLSWEVQFAFSPEKIDKLYPFIPFTKVV